MILMEELSRVAPPLAVIRGTNDLFVTPLLLFGSDELKRKYVPPIARGEAFGAHAMTEPCCGSDVAGIQTRAVKKGDRWVINGRKIFISNADIADYIMVFARTSEPQPNRRWFGITASLLRRGRQASRLVLNSRRGV